MKKPNQKHKDIVKNLSIPTPPPEVLEYLKSIYMPVEFLDIMLPVLFGQAKQYPLNNWLEPDGQTMSKRVNYGCIATHTADAYNNIRDTESCMDSQLPAAWRLMADYVRIKRGIRHSEDYIPLVVEGD